MHVIVAILLLSAFNANAQFGSSYREEYEKEKNGPHGECRADWKRVATGIDYRAITCLGDEDDVDVHAFRVSSEFFTLEVAAVTNGSSARRQADVRESKFVINANFFEKDRSPIGVIVRDGSQLQPPRKSSWQSIFLTDESGVPHIIPVSRWPEYSRRARMAVQAGPRLVVNGHTNRIRNGYAAARAGVCIRKKGELIFFATPNTRKLDVFEIGRVARRAEIDGGLECQESMLFDGGHSTQFYLEGDEKPIRVDGDPVPVFVFVKRK